MWTSIYPRIGGGRMWRHTELGGRSIPVRSNGGESTFPLPTFALVTQWRGGLGLAGVYSGEYVDRSCCTICSAATCATRAPLDDVPACFVTTFLGERTPVVGRVGLRVRERTRALDTGPWTELSIEPGDERPQGEAGRPRRRWRERGDLHRL